MEAATQARAPEGLAAIEEAARAWAEAKRAKEAADQALLDARRALEHLVPPGHPLPPSSGLRWERRVHATIIAVHQVPDWMLQPALHRPSVHKWRKNNPTDRIPGTAEEVSWVLRIADRHPRQPIGPLC